MLDLLTIGLAVLGISAVFLFAVQRDARKKMKDIDRKLKNLGQ